MCCVSIADARVLDEFSAELSDLSQHAICHLGIGPNLDLNTAFSAMADFSSVRDGTDWADSAAFARVATTLIHEETPFVIRLPLKAGSDEEVQASREALKLFARTDSLANLHQAFANDPALGLVGPDVLFKPLFPEIGPHFNEFGTLGETEDLHLIDHDHGAFPLQSFAISATLLRDLTPTLERYDEFLQEERDRNAYAHPSNIGKAMDLAWVSLAAAKGRDAGLARLRLGDQACVIRSGPGRVFARETGRTERMLDTLRRQSRAQPDFDLLDREGDFDAAAYSRANRAALPDGFGALEHFVLYGDAAKLQLGHTPSLSAYRLTCGSRLSPFDNTLAHWIVNGRPDPSPPDNKLLAEAKARRMYDPDWCLKTFPDLKSRDRAERLILGSTALSQRPTSRHFDPTEVPVLNGSGLVPEDRGLRAFMRDHFTNERRSYDELHAALQNNDLGLAENLTSRIEDLYGPSSALLAARAYLSIVERDWNRAKAALSTLWDDRLRGTTKVRHKTNLISEFPLANARFDFAQANDRVDLRDVCIYTTIFGGIDELLPILRPVPGLKFICFTDRDLKAPGWDVRIVKPRFASSNLSAKYYKILPHEVFTEFRYSMFVDGNTLITGHIEKFIQQFLAGQPFAMWRHPERSDVYREAVAILQSGRHRAQEILPQIKAYAEEGLPHRSGMAEASFVWRDHTCNKTTALMDAWWDQIMRFSHRDQLSLAYLFWKTGHRPRVLPPKLGTSRQNAFFLKVPHRKSVAKRTTPDLAPITFLYHPDRRYSGSCVMRGEQLSAMVADAMPERDVSFSAGLHWHGRVLFLTKGFLEKTPLADLRRLRDAGNLLIGDFVDAKPDVEKGKLMHVLAASSIAAYQHYASAFPTTPVHHLTHHVDPRIPSGNDAAEFSCGYIGETVNAILTPAIQHSVTVARVNTKTLDNSWLSYTRDFNFHYAVRAQREIDGFKPFLKGFTAARCAAPIMTQKSIGDAIYYLGEDYPFFLPSDPSEKEILDVLDDARTAFGGPVWADALERMADVADRTSDRAVVEEFKAILAT